MMMDNMPQRGRNRRYPSRGANRLFYGGIVLMGVLEVWMVWGVVVGGITWLRVVGMLVPVVVVAWLVVNRMLHLRKLEELNRRLPDRTQN
jgi:hypothetical protein